MSIPIEPFTFQISPAGGIETSGDSLAGSEQCCCLATGEGTSHAVCVCGGNAREGTSRDPLDGLPPASEPIQARLHQIILHQRVSYDVLVLL